MRLNSNKKHLLLLIAVLLIGILFHWVGILVAILCAERYFATRYKIGVIYSLFLATVGVASVIAVVIFIIDSVLPFNKVFLLINILMLFISCGIFYLNYSSFSYSINFRKRELVPLFISLASALFLLMPVLQVSSTSQFIQFLSSGEDNASHFAMFHRSLIEQSAPYFDGNNTGLIKSLEIYPQGIHSYSSFIYWSIFNDNSNHSLKTLLILFYLSSIAACSLMMFAYSALLELYSRSKLWLVVNLISSVLVFIGVALFLMGWGFITQIVALGYLIIILLILKLNAENKQEINTWFVYTIGVFTLGVVFSWYLLLPIIFLVLFPLFVRFFRYRQFKMILPIIVISLLCALPIMLNVFFGKGASAINEPGGVYQYGYVGYVIMLVGLIISVYGFFLKDIKKYYSSLLAFSLASFLLTAVIGIYQLISIGSLQYYFYKSTFLLVIIGIFSASIALMYLVKKLHLHKNFIFNSIIIGMLFVVAVIVAKPVYPQVYANNWFNHILQPNTLDSSIGLFPSGSHDVMNIIECDRVQEYIANRWNGAIYLTEDTERSKLALERLRYNAPLSHIEDYRMTHKNVIFIHLSCQ